MGSAAFSEVASAAASGVGPLPSVPSPPVDPVPPCAAGAPPPFFARAASGRVDALRDRPSASVDHDEQACDHAELLAMRAKRHLILLANGRDGTV